MNWRTLKLRFRRKFRRSKKQATQLGEVADVSVDKYLIRRLINLAGVWRFVLGWTALIILICVAVILQSNNLNRHYKALVPTEGGFFREGIVGEFTNSNPLYAQTEVDLSVSKLVFSGLYKYNSNGDLVPDLAEKFELDKAEKTYKVFLKKDVKWHDGTEFTAKDVVFTYKTIQDIDAKSYLYSSWAGVDVKAIDDYTVAFTLSNSLGGFIYSLTNGIVPEHLLGEISPSQMRATTFNTQNPTGTGPFKYSSLEAKTVGGNDARVVLEANRDYFAGDVKLERFSIGTYQDEDAVVDDYNDNKIDAIAGLKSLPEELSGSESSVNYVPLSNEVMVFFRNTQDVLKDKAVRQALVLATDKSKIGEELDRPVSLISGPLLGSQIGYDPSLMQKTNQVDKAKEILDKAGWKLDPQKNVRIKNKKELSFKLYSGTNSEFSKVASILQKQWQDIGAKVEVVLEQDQELQGTVTSHNYDALIYGIAVGADPDVYVYWHSSGFGKRSQTKLNFSEYSSEKADKALEASRTRSDPGNRAIKLKPFLEAWQADFPALALYQQQYIYVTSPSLNGFDSEYMHTGVDRYTNVANWTIKKKSQTLPVE